MLSLLLSSCGVSARECGGGACVTARDCQLAGECTGGKCVCDPGWAGSLCEVLDLVPLPAGTEGAAWNSEHSPRSSWGATVLKNPKDGKYHGFFNQLPGVCGLSSWLPGSNIAHGVADTPVGPFSPAPTVAPSSGVRNPLSQFATNPHAIYVNSSSAAGKSARDGRTSGPKWLIFFNGRKWVPNDLTACEPNVTGAAPWHGSGACAHDDDCPGFGAHTPHAQHPGRCVAGACVCEHHSFGPHCEQIVETVNVASADAPEGPWTQLLPDGAPFWDDGNTSLALSNPSAFALPNGTVVLAYSRAPGTGVSVAPHWTGPYTRLYLDPIDPTTTTTATTADSADSAAGGGAGAAGGAAGGAGGSGIDEPGAGAGPPAGFAHRNYSLVGCGEDPFIYRDFRGTWRVICHGKTLGAGADPRFPGAKLETGGQAFSTDLLYWTPGPTAVYTSAMEYADADHHVPGGGPATTTTSTRPPRPFAKRERPSLMVDARGFPTFLYTGVQAPNASYVPLRDRPRVPLLERRPSHAPRRGPARAARGGGGARCQEAVELRVQRQQTAKGLRQGRVF